MGVTVLPGTQNLGGTVTYDYPGSKTPLLLFIVCYCNGGSSTGCYYTATFYGAGGAVIASDVNIYGNNINAQNDGGSGMTNSGMICVPFPTGCKKIVFTRHGLVANSGLSIIAMIDI
jgi:hypothetical protein